MKDSLALIDTDILIFILKNNDKAIACSKEYQIKYGKLKISQLTYYECLRGYQTSKSQRKLDLFHQIVSEIEVFALDKSILDKASEVYAKLREIGCPTGEFDLLIASTALVNGFMLITNNTKDYLKIKEHFGLELDNWME